MISFLRKTLYSKILYYNALPSFEGRRLPKIIVTTRNSAVGIKTQLTFKTEEMVPDDLAMIFERIMDDVGSAMRAWKQESWINVTDDCFQVKRVYY
jgi:hypothetical protein